MYRVGICEDDAPLSGQLCELCGNILVRLDMEHEICAYASAEELKKALGRGERFDLLCLDILMPGETGMDLARDLRRGGDETSIIFITSSTDYLLEGYSVRPIQYLLKPVDREALERIIADDIRRKSPRRAVSVRVGNKTTVLALSEILYVESRNHGCTFVLTDREETFWLPMGRAESMLPPGCFFRCHNSYLVNLARVVRVDTRGVELAGGKVLPVSRRLAADFQRALTRFLNDTP